MEKKPIVKELSVNEKAIRDAFSSCDDLKFRRMQIGKNKKLKCTLCYIEVSVGNEMLNVFGRFVSYLDSLTDDAIIQAVEGNAYALSDATPYTYMEDAIRGVLIGDAVLFVDGFAGALKIPDKGYPKMGVSESDTEKVVRGSNESFTESEKANTALIRKRIRNTGLKVKEMQVGVRSFTNVAIVYIEDLVQPGLVEEVERRFLEYEVDGVMDSGVLEQLAEEAWYSPFPQFHSTRRPDRAAMSVLDGKVVVLVDNSPIALLVPADVNSFLKTTDDYYNRFFMASFARIIRYVSAFFALTLPGLYLAVTNFHTQILPTPLLLSFWEARIGVPFPAALEVLLMELSFELLREAGVRLPGAMGNTIGIVGGLIIGQAAVDANLVSPIVVIVVALTAIASFSVPNETMAGAFRLLKFFILAMSALWGLYGFFLGWLFLIVHLCSLESFGQSYLMADESRWKDAKEKYKDEYLRLPLFLMWRRPSYTREGARIRKRKEKKK